MVDAGAVDPPRAHDGAFRRAGTCHPRHLLAATLRTLETDGYVARRAYPEVPPRVEYRLTPLGETLMPHIAGLIEWAERHRAAVAAARADDDRRTERTAPATRTAPAGPDTRSDRNP